MTKVVSKDGESPESLLKRFRKRVTQDGILSTARKKRYFVSKSEQGRIARRKAIRRERRRLWREKHQRSGGGRRTRRNDDDNDGYRGRSRGPRD